MKNILVPLGISPNDVATLKYATDFAAHYNATLYLIDNTEGLPGSFNIHNIGKKIEQITHNKLEQIIEEAKVKNNAIKIVDSEEDLIDTIHDLDEEVNLDLIITSPSSMDFKENFFLGKSTGRIVKQSRIPVLLAPINAAFTSPTKALFAVKKRQVKQEKSLSALKALFEKFSFSIHLLLVKTPEYKEEQAKTKNAFLSENVTENLTTENATVYQGVLEYFKVVNPDFLVVFRRKKGFFEKLWESNVVYKKDFYCTIPLLVLKEF